MIKQVHIQNFKCLRDVTVELEPFTVLIGPNDSGKSSFLQSLQLLTKALSTDGPEFTATREMSNLTWRCEGGAFAIEAWTAYVNRQGCAAFSEFASVIDSFPASCSPIGLALLLVAAIASVTAAILLVGTTRVGRGVMFVLAGIVLAPLLLYVLSIATFALRAA